jgi:AraC-like DNA-binding protein
VTEFYKIFFQYIIYHYNANKKDYFMNIIVHESPYIDSIVHIPADAYRIECDYAFRGSPSVQEHIILNHECALLNFTIHGQEYVFDTHIVCGKFVHPPKISIVFKESEKNLTVIRLSSYGMYKLTDIPIASMVDTITPGSTLSIDLTDDIEEESVLEWIETMSTRPNDSPSYRITRDIIHYVDAHDTDLPADITRSLAEHFAISPSTLLRYFKKYIGITPSTYVLTLRRKKMIRSICNRQHGAMSALESGYYDQSHFLNDFRRLYGISLREYFAEMQKMKKIAPEFTHYLHNCPLPA